MDQQNQSAGIIRKKKPTFLVVLCILSFVGIGFVIISSIISLLSPFNSIASFERFGKEFNTLLSNTDIAKMMYFTRIRTIVDLVSAFICLAGVLMMWKLMKMGFFIYIIGEIAPLIISTFLYWDVVSNPFLSFVFWTGTLLALIFSIAFVIMYGVNLKYMTYSNRINHN